jgi:hypothetical protein
LKRVKKVDVKIVVLENAGYYPLEQPGGTDARGHPIISQGYRGFSLDSVKISFLVMFEFLSGCAPYGPLLSGDVISRVLRKLELP